MYKIDPVINEFIKTTMKSWKLLMSLPNKKGTIELDECSIRRGIFQGDSFSPLNFLPSDGTPFENSETSKDWPQNK